MKAINDIPDPTATLAKDPALNVAFNKAPKCQQVLATFGK